MDAREFVVFSGSSFKLGAKDEIVENKSPAALVSRQPQRAQARKLSEQRQQVRGSAEHLQQAVGIVIDETDSGDEGASLLLRERVSAVQLVAATWEVPAERRYTPFAIDLEDFLAKTAQCASLIDGHGDVTQLVVGLEEHFKELQRLAERIGKPVKRLKRSASGAELPELEADASPTQLQQANAQERNADKFPDLLQTPDTQVDESLTLNDSQWFDESQISQL